MDSVSADLGHRIVDGKTVANDGTIHVEICAHHHSGAKVVELKNRAVEFVESLVSVHVNKYLRIYDFKGDRFLQDNVQFLTISEGDVIVYDRSHIVKGRILVRRCLVIGHVYQLHQDDPMNENIDDEDSISAATHWLLPSAEYDGMWENLIYEESLKRSLIKYATSTMLFSKKNVDPNIISWNRVVLFHGPPGTGKTTLCKALAQKLCIRLSHKFRNGQLVEINTHGLFSKYFSESGKLVVKMFQNIQKVIDDKDTLVCILIDEVESLSASRKMAMGANEPSDAIRVVNALLTSIDKIKRYPNVLILTTSNMTGLLDLAFVDRADIKHYIGPPIPQAIYQIYSGCLNELMRTGIICPPVELLDYADLDRSKSGVQKKCTDSDTSISQYLWGISKKSESISGRTLRKMPFLTHANELPRPLATMREFLTHMEKTIEHQFEERTNLTKDSLENPTRKQDKKGNSNGSNNNPLSELPLSPAPGRENVEPFRSEQLW